MNHTVLHGSGEEVEKVATIYIPVNILYDILLLFQLVMI